MKKLQSFFITGVLLILSCQRGPLDVNTSGIDIEINILRFEKDLFESDHEDLPATIQSISAKHEEFLSLFSRVIRIGEAGSPGYQEYLSLFLSDEINNEVYAKTMETFPDLDDLENELTDAFKHYRYYFPEKEIPAVYSFVSRFNTSLIIGESILGIGLDRYLGRDCEYYQQLGLPQYARFNMHGDKIVPDCMYAWASTEWSFEGEDSREKPSQNVLNHMIYQGKLLYFVQAMIPDAEEGLIMGFSEEQMKWCRMNEQTMWVYLIEQKLLYDTDYMTINKLTKEGPFTSYFPRESPARASVWLGWQIVKKYMERVGDVSLNELMDDTDYQKILQLSQYNP